MTRMRRAGQLSQPSAGAILRPARHTGALAPREWIRPRRGAVHARLHWCLRTRRPVRGGTPLRTSAPMLQRTQERRRLVGVRRASPRRALHPRAGERARAAAAPSTPSSAALIDGGGPPARPCGASRNAIVLLRRTSSALSRRGPCGARRLSGDKLRCVAAPAVRAAGTKGATRIPLTAPCVSATGLAPGAAEAGEAGTEHPAEAGTRGERARVIPAPRGEQGDLRIAQGAGSGVHQRHAGGRQALVSATAPRVERGASPWAAGDHSPAAEHDGGKGGGGAAPAGAAARAGRGACKGVCRRCCCLRRGGVSGPGAGQGG